MHLPACASAACDRALTPVKKVDSADENTLKKDDGSGHKTTDPRSSEQDIQHSSDSNAIVFQFIHFNRNKMVPGITPTFFIDSMDCMKKRSENHRSPGYG